MFLYSPLSIYNNGMNECILHLTGIQIISATLMDEWREVANC